MDDSLYDASGNPGLSGQTLLTSRGLAKLLQLPLRTIDKETRNRTIPHFQPPHFRRCYFSLPWIDAWPAVPSSR